jgi:hypothetical protein
MFTAPRSMSACVAVLMSHFGARVSSAKRRTRRLPASDLRTIQRQRSESS